MNPQEQSAEANLRLEELYRPLLEPWRELRGANSQLSIPMFLKTTPAYFASRPRMVFVGQETHGWWTDCAIAPGGLGAREIMDFYQGEVMNKYRLHSSSPFWRAIRKVSTALGISPLPESVMSANLFPCDSDKTQAPGATLDQMRAWRILPEELKILDPEFVVFFVGPVYAPNLANYFGVPVASLDFTRNLLQDYNPGNVNWRGWVTYHPTNLLRGRHSSVIDQIIERIRGTSV